MAIWPALNFTAHNWADVLRDGAGALTGVLLVVLFVGAMGHALHALLSRRNEGALAVVLFVAAICLFFGYSLIHDATAGLLARLNVVAPPSLGWLLLSLIVAGAIFASRKHEGLKVAAMVFSFSATGFAAWELSVAASRIEKDSVAAPATDGRPLTTDQPNLAGPDVYYFLLDGYSGQTGLREFSGFDNSPFIDDMKRRGFVDATNITTRDQRSNYLFTPQTLGSIFALDYPMTRDEKTWQEPWRLFPSMVDGARVPPLIRQLESAGYTVWQTFNTWAGCSGRNMRCLGGHGSLVFDYMTMAFVATTPLGRAVTLSLGRRVDGLVSLAEHLPVMKASKQPFFVFVHSLTTHPPFYLNAECERRDLQQADIDFSWKNTPAYVGAVKCVNAKVTALVDSILADNPNALIVLQSDHGSGFTVDWELPLAKWPVSFVRERGSILNLIKAPGACARWLDRSLAQINTARFVVGCVSGHAPQYLPEQTYISVYAREVGHFVVQPFDEQDSGRN